MGYPFQQQPEGKDNGELKTVSVGPRYQPSTTEDTVKVPFLQAIITAAPAGIAAALLIWRVVTPLLNWFIAWLNGATGWNLPVRISIFDCLFWGFITFLGVFAWQWYNLREYWIWLVEQIRKQDIDGNGKINQFPALPPKQEIIHTLQLQKPGLYGPEAVNIQELGKYWARLIVVAKGLADGRGFTYAEWAKGKDGIFSEPEWKDLLEILSAKGLAYKINPNIKNSQYDLTDTGKQVFRALAGEEQQGSMTVIQPQIKPMTVNALDVDALGPTTPLEWKR